jgi:hypothetical protein
VNGKAPGKPRSSGVEGIRMTGARARDRAERRSFYGE